MHSGQCLSQTLLLPCDERARLYLIGRVGKRRHARGLREHVDIPDVLGCLHPREQCGAADGETEAQAGDCEELR